MTELKRREEEFPSPSRMKQLKARWIKKISNLKDIMDGCNEIVNKKEMLLHLNFFLEKFKNEWAILSFLIKGHRVQE